MEIRTARAFPLLFAAFASATCGSMGERPASAQSARYELGRRYRAFEETLERRSDPETLRAALPHLETAMRNFFALRPKEAARALDLARCALEGAPGPGEGGKRAGAAELWAQALAFEPDRRLVDPSEEKLGFAVRAFYPPEAKMSVGATFRARLELEGAAPVELPLEALPARGELSVRGAPPGESAVAVEVVRGAETLAAWRVPVSFAARASERIDGLEKRLGSLPEGGRRLEMETVRGLLEILRSLRAGEVLETDYPACRLLEEAEAALAAAEASPGSYAAAAALGGGWRVGSAGALRDFPLFLGAGSEDFAFAGVERLARRLADAKARAVEFRRYPDVEHIAVVPLALRDVFSFFDGAARRAGAPGATGERGPPAPAPRSPTPSGRPGGDGSRARGRRRAPRA